MANAAGRRRRAAAAVVSICAAPLYREGVGDCGYTHRYLLTCEMNLYVTPTEYELRSL